MKESLFSNIYQRVRKLLINPFCNAFANTFSHGGTHFIFLLIVGAVTFYFLSQNKKEVINTHNLGVQVDWLSNIKEGKPDASGVSLDNVSIHVLLNNESINSVTNGKYNNGVIVEFDGKTVKRIVHTPTKPASPISPAQYSTSESLDSIVVSLFSDPKIASFSTDVRIDSLLGKVENHYHDSITGFLTKQINVFKAADTHVKYSTKFFSDSTVSVFVAPIQYSVGRTRHYAYFYSNEIGVREDEPYYYYYISFPRADFSGELKIEFNVSELQTNDTYNIKYSNKKNLQYNFIYPEPDVVGNGRIEYYSSEKKEQIRKNQGVIIQAVDIDALNRQNRMAFLFSVLVGTGFAFLIDIIIQLIRELRRIQK